MKTEKELLNQLKKYNIHIRKRKNESTNDFQQRIETDDIYIIQQAKKEWEEKRDKKWISALQTYLLKNRQILWANTPSKVIEEVLSYLNATEP